MIHSPFSKVHWLSIRLHEFCFDDFKEGFPQSFVVNVLGFEMKCIASVLPLIGNHAQEILRLVSDDNTAHRIRKHMQHPIVDLPVGTKCFVSMDESPATKHTQLNDITIRLPINRLIHTVSQVHYIGNLVLVQTHDEIRPHFKFVMSVIVLDKPVHL